MAPQRVGIFTSILMFWNIPSLVPRLCPQERGGGESLVTKWKKLSTYAALLWRYQSDCRMKPCVQVTLYSIGVTNSSVLAEFNIPITQGKHFSLHSAKSCQLENELLNIDYNSKVGEKQFSDVWKRCKSWESKIKVYCSCSVGPTYFAAPSLRVRSVP